MFKMVTCSKEKYDQIAKFCTIEGGWFQENAKLKFVGVTLASMQPNMIGKVGEPDFYWCRRFLT